MWAALAQLVEHRIRNAGVRGSNPLSGTRILSSTHVKSFIFCCLRGVNAYSKKAFPLQGYPALFAGAGSAAAADFRNANAPVEVLLREARVKSGISVAPKRGRPPKDALKAVE
jgi:hypothetical protein